MRRMPVTGLVLTLVALGACGSRAGLGVDAAAEMDAAPPAERTDTRGPEPAYDGPLFIRGTQNGTDWIKRGGAAAHALHCDGRIYRGYMDGEIPEFGGGAEPEDALHGFLEMGPNRTPDSGFRLARRDGDRVLFTYDVNGKTKVALIAVKRTSDVDSFGEPINKSGWPWTGESWAQCDPTEFDPAADAEHDSDIWSDAERPRVPVSEIESRPAYAHCWPGATIVRVKTAGRSYVRDPQKTFSADLLSTTYEADSALPDDAIDTGYFHRDRHLWLGADKLAAYVVTPGNVERWPAITGQAACG